MSQTTVANKKGEQTIRAMDRIMASSIKVIYESKDQANIKQAQENLAKALALKLKVMGIEVPQL